MNSQFVPKISYIVVCNIFFIINKSRTKRLSTILPAKITLVNSYTLELGAVKFGDVPGSYTQIHIAGGNVWQHEFSLEFDFRTYYPNGLLIYVSPSIKQKRHTISVFLRDGKITILMKMRIERELIVPKITNDGNWHHVSIRLSHKRLAVTVGSIPKITRMPKKILLSNVLYIGGLPEKSQMHKWIPEKISKIERFKGCVRRMVINGKPEDLVKDPALHRNVGQCFPSIEMGSYFPGDSYAIFNSKFVITSHLELRLEFRTVEVNGVLMSVSQRSGSPPALSLELHNAKVIMSALTLSGERLRVAAALPDQFGLCDNTWHNITAEFSGNELSIRIDRQPEVTYVGKNLSPTYNSLPSINQPALHAPLYIGGLPDGESTGTLTIKDNFKGCIRNVVIQEQIKDWTDMDYLHHILLSSCPIQ